MSDLDKPQPVLNEAGVTLTVRMIMNGKEVGSIIGKGGEIINSIREDSNAKIHISGGSVPERIVTVTGSTDAILKAFNMICKEFEDDGPREGSSATLPRPPITLRLIVPASQCGSLIGKGGSKIKEIRETSGASIQVASEMLPQSTERAVTISGTRDAISQCIYHVCTVMLESPPKGTTIPYTPKGGSALGLMGVAAATGGRGARGGGLGGGDNQLAGLLNLGGGGATLAALATLAGSQIRDRRDSSRDERSSSSNPPYEMSIPNDLIGCIIGKGGSKIAEIRQISGAMIRISKSDDRDSDRDSDRSSGSERLITITGSPDSVTLAKSLINMSLDIHKSKMEERNGGGESGSGREGGIRDRERSDRHDGYASSASGSAGNLGLAAQLLAKPEALTTALTTLASLGGLGGGLLGGLGGGSGHGMPVTGAHRSRGGYSSSSRSSNRDDDRGRDSKRSKFAPY